MQAPQQDETASGGTHELVTFFIIVGILVFIGLGLFIGFIVGSNKDNPSNSQTLGAQISPVPTGIQFLNDSSQSSASDNTNSWTLYTDINYSIKYPVTWLVKKGFSAKDDLIIYDPKSVKQSGQSRIPTAYVDILSITASTQSASQIVDNYKNSLKEKSTILQSEQSPTLGVNLVLFDNPGASGKNVLWSQDTMLAQFNTSMQHFADTSTENKILQTFQFIKQQQPQQSQQ